MWSVLRKQFLRHSAVTARSPTSPLASQRSFLFPTLGKQIIGSSRMTRSQSTSTHFYLLWKPFNRIPRAINNWMCLIPHFALPIIHISFKKNIISCFSEDVLWKRIFYPRVRFSYFICTVFSVLLLHPTCINGKEEPLHNFLDKIECSFTALSLFHYLFDLHAPK